MLDLEQEMSRCRVCPRKCGADREHGKTGYCKAPSGVAAARAALHFWEEPCISGTTGSGTVFFSGCNLRCVYCQNHHIAEMESGKVISIGRLSDIFLELQAQNANNINLVTPSHYVLQIREALLLAKEKGLTVPVVYNCGGKKETLSGIEKRAYNYRSFLKQFTVTREEMELDLDSFDPVAYHYGLEHYGSLPFIEPPETREGNRLEELVIAIDTSGSCKREIVAKFLGETRSILEEKENFFSRWNVCLIQCDSFVQDVTMIHSPKEWEAYRETITIKGRGGTDFRPVFQKVEELRKQHVFRNLKALIYFTDGDGIYPEQKPDYETAFVFVRQTEKMNLVPKWAKKLLTEECTL